MLQSVSEGRLLPTSLSPSPPAIPRALEGDLRIVIVQDRSLGFNVPAELGLVILLEALHEGFEDLGCGRSAAGQSQRTASESRTGRLTPRGGHPLLVLIEPDERLEVRVRDFVAPQGLLAREAERDEDGLFPAAAKDLEHAVGRDLHAAHDQEDAEEGIEALVLRDEADAVEPAGGRVGRDPDGDAGVGEEGAEAAEHGPGRGVCRRDESGRVFFGERGESGEQVFGRRTAGGGRICAAAGGGVGGVGGAAGGGISDALSGSRP